MKSLSLPTFVLALLGVSMLLAGCQSQEVPSGTYDGVIVEVNPAEQEIYVDSDGKELELYFTPGTKVVGADGMPATFADLSKDALVRVTVENTDGHLKPVKVEILK